MILLTGTSDQLQFAVTTALSTDWNVSWNDMNFAGSTMTPGSAQGNQAAIGTVALIAPPVAGDQRQVKFLSIVNRDAVNPQTVTVQKLTGAGTYNLTGAWVLQAGWMLEYVDGDGFKLLNAVGAIQYVGSAGATGVTGAPGPQGPPYSMDPELPEEPLHVPGPIGMQGPTGSQGPVGPPVFLEAEAPNDGDPGAPGVAGTPGATGSQGPMGPPVFLEADPGDEGQPGSPGAQGIQGTPGLTGATGPAVYLEADALEGDIGPPGIQGIQGVTGSQGPIGPPVYLDADPGEEGQPGAPGAQGIQGLTGSQGPVGPAAFLEADQGPDGDQGFPGPTGATGGTGLQGIQGDQGDPGDDGVPIPGSQGIQGVPGATGGQGPSGYGPPGADGDQGEDGMPIPGNQGPQGVQGLTGAQGPNGPVDNLLWVEVDRDDEAWLALLPNYGPPVQQTSAFGAGSAPVNDPHLMWAEADRENEQYPMQAYQQPVNPEPLGTASGTAVAATTITYVTPAFPIPVNGSLAIGMKWRIKLLVTNTATAVTTTVTTKYGTAGTTADTTVQAFALGAGTAAAGTAIIEVEMQVKALSATVGAIVSSIEVRQTGTTGFTNAAQQIATATLATLNTTIPNNKIGVCLTCTTASVVTVVSTSFEICGSQG